MVPYWDDILTQHSQKLVSYQLNLTMNSLVETESLLSQPNWLT